MSVGCWSLISKTATKARSSHCVTVTNNCRLLVYGGELVPRKPVDGSLYSFDLNSHSEKPEDSWIPLSPIAVASSEMPEPRVGATTVWDPDSESLYLWGGRGGIDMTPLGGSQPGVWKGQIKAGSSGSVEWKRLKASNEDEAPEPRSYHAAVLCERKFYIHAGCPESGRLNTLSSFDLSTISWKTLSPAPGPPRGGTSLVATSLRGEDGPVILRFAGFAGHELGEDHTLDIYHVVSDIWETITPSPDSTHGFPGPRSVHGFVPFASKTMNPDAIALLYHGEKTPSSQGHEGAGTFWNDLWLLEYGDKQYRWNKVEVEQKDENPEGRGWFPSASYMNEEGETKVVLFGGLLKSNARSDELWVLSIK